MWSTMKIAVTTAPAHPMSWRYFHTSTGIVKSAHRANAPTIPRAHTRSGSRRSPGAARPIVRASLKLPLHRETPLVQERLGHVLDDPDHAFDIPRAADVSH